jgi:hypothetical protein
MPSVISSQVKRKSHPSQTQFRMVKKAVLSYLAKTEQQLKESEELTERQNFGSKTLFKFKIGGPGVLNI